MIIDSDSALAKPGKCTCNEYLKTASQQLHVLYYSFRIASSSTLFRQTRRGNRMRVYTATF